jgi:hypothetical protein
MIIGITDPPLKTLPHNSRLPDPSACELRNRNAAKNAKLFNFALDFDFLFPLCVLDFDFSWRRLLGFLLAPLLL